MVSCKQCSTLNSLDSAFCKKCGATIDANDIAIANEKLAIMIADGNRLFAEGRTDDALMVADTAISANPTLAVAVSLKGMCLERKGLLAEALECFERVVELQPDSTLDKLKVNDLKNMLAVEKFEVNQRPDRKMAVVGAVAASVLVVACGALFAKASASDGKVDQKPTLVAQNDSPKTFGEIMTDPNSSGQKQADPQSQSQAQPEQNQGNGGVPDPTPRPGQEQLRIPPYGGRTIPRPEGMSGEIPFKINPEDVPDVQRSSNGGTENQKSSSQPPQPPTGGSDPDPGVTPPTGGESKTPEPPKNDPGIIEIEVSKGSPNRTGNSEPANNNGRTALLSTARSQMMAGNYSAAAATFERALRAGADQGSTNQRLGQCYTQLGRNGDAVAAYGRAAAAFEKAGNSQGADACRQAIKVLGG